MEIEKEFQRLDQAASWAAIYQIAKLCFCTTAVKKKPFRILKRLYPSNNVQDALLEQIEYLGGKIEMDVKKKKGT